MSAFDNSYPHSSFYWILQMSISSISAWSIFYFASEELVTCEDHTVRKYEWLHYSNAALLLSELNSLTSPLRLAERADLMTLYLKHSSQSYQPTSSSLVIIPVNVCSFSIHSTIFDSFFLHLVIIMVCKQDSTPFPKALYNGAPVHTINNSRSGLIRIS